MKNSLEAKIIKKENQKTILEVERQKISLDSECLPPGEDKLKLYFLNGNEQVADKKLAKMILEEILNGK